MKVCNVLCTGTRFSTNVSRPNLTNIFIKMSHMNWFGRLNVIVITVMITK